MRLTATTWIGAVRSTRSCLDKVQKPKRGLSQFSFGSDSNDASVSAGGPASASPRSGCGVGDASDEVASPVSVATGSETASDQRPPSDSYKPRLRPP